MQSLVCSVLLPLDRQYILPRAPRLLSLWDLSLDLFKHKILLSDSLQAKLFDRVLSSVNAQRNANSIDSTHYKSLHLSLLSMIQTLNFYQPLKERILKSTKDFYEIESKKSIEDLEVDGYLTKAWERIQQEQAMSKWIFLSGSSQDAIKKNGEEENDKIVYTELIGKHTEVLGKGECGTHSTPPLFSRSDLALPFVFQVYLNFSLHHSANPFP